MKGNHKLGAILAVLGIITGLLFQTDPGSSVRKKANTRQPYSTLED